MVTRVKYNKIFVKKIDNCHIHGRKFPERLYSKKFFCLNRQGLLSYILLLLFKWLPENSNVKSITISVNSKNSDEFLAAQALAKLINSTSKITKVPY
jgi:hypothetical protein